MSLGPITFLVGPNGAGKSNFVEALRFLSYGLSSSLEQALDARSGFRSIVHKGAGQHRRSLSRSSSGLGDEETGTYVVQIGAGDEGPVSVIEEECTVRSARREDWFKVRSGVVTSNQRVTPAASEEKLYLVNASGVPAFEPVYRALFCDCCLQPCSRRNPRIQAREAIQESSEVFDLKPTSVGGLDSVKSRSCRASLNC